MKKIYFSILSILVASSASAQLNSNGPVKRSVSRTELKPTNYGTGTPEVSNKISFFESTFDTPSEWVLDHDAADCSLDWSIGNVSCAGSYPIDDINSTTAGDGWAMVDSDFYGGEEGGSEVEDSWLTMANSVDLTGYPNVVVEFETYYRPYSYEAPYLVVGFGDGSGAASVVWPNLDPDTDITAMTNVYEIFPNASQGTATDNPYKVQVNISSALAAAGQVDDVFIRLNWTGTWGYAWFVDDFKIVEQPNDDIQVIASWISGENNGGVEYGTTPPNHVDANYTIGSQILNFGVNDQTGVALSASFTGAGVINSAGAEPTLLSGDTATIENLEAITFNEGIYTGTYTAVSAAETGGPEFYNNTRLRNMEISPSVKAWYAQDGIDVHPAADLTLNSLGTNSFTDGADGFIVGALYHMKQSDELSGIRVMLASGSVEGTEVKGLIMDTSDFWLEDFTAPLFETSTIILSQSDIDQGYVDLAFGSIPTVGSGIIYACVEMYSSANTYDMRILDDKTVPQPADASVIYIPGATGGSYTNGEALGVRLLTGSDWNLSIDETKLEGVSVYPNPSTGLINITNSNGSENTIVVYDMVGKIVASTTSSVDTEMNLASNGTGVYIVKVSNGTGTFVERVVIK